MPKKATYKTAIGLEYDPNSDDAPIVGVKGELLSADEIVKLAKRFGVPVVEKPELAQALLPLDVEDSIPEDLFETVAGVFGEIKKLGR